MLDNTTKRRIDNARDILVGKVPDPKAQVEQITTALIYKFMFDMDQESVEIGGEPAFFVGEYDQYAWSKLMDKRLGGHARLDLYVRAITSMSQNPHIPQLFRDIFKGAFLPYRDPETLNLFLKEIDVFTYDHSERLGDAFEYLLSILGSQGAAGQFRTPRHIIDFIVAAVAPTKTDTILDPACGTAGFLISAYKHILASNQDTPLTPDERQRITQNFVGYDIAPEMVRLSLVNMYLHKFPQPTIYEYDTLTSEERWDDNFDVILANPPFMTPKGGIRPHNRFSVQTNRSEVLFVDYIAEHINLAGRAGVIVPEGIIFQSTNAYKALRKMLVTENYLWAVVSLPVGVFNPYSGVKTSILLMDKNLARRADRILIIDIQNDGYDLGAQRREIDQDDLPQALDLLHQFQAKPTLEFDIPQALTVPKTRLAEDGDYNLTAGRYREVIDYRKVKWPLVLLDDLCLDILSGGTPSTKVEEHWTGEIPWITSADIIDLNTATPRKFITQQAIKESATNLIPKGNIVVVTRVGLGKLFLNDFDVCISQDSQGLILNQFKVVPEFLVYVLRSEVQRFQQTSQGTTIQGVTKKQLRSIQIPLPPLDIQRSIVAEIESYQAIITGARQVLAAYTIRLSIDPAWPVVDMKDIMLINQETTNPIVVYGDATFIYVDISSVENGTGRVSFDNMLVGNEAPSRARRVARDGDILLSTVRPNLKAFAYLTEVPENTVVSTGFAVLTATEKVMPQYVYYLLFTELLQQQMMSRMGKGSYPSINQKDVQQLKIPLPSLETQQAIVTKIEHERLLVDANQQLIEIFQSKIDAAIARVWGEESTS